ncbi:hypothetical protein Tco_0821452 [Tanacetum coccineum]|uniref:Uncharacterized protein n=1 Tax=Tanacetum coccineum TaxID=301880 RepID=A0ABQ5AGE5_9ASTR
MDDAEKNDEDKAEKEKDIDQEPIQDEQAKDEVACVLVSMTHKEKPKLLISASSQSVSSNYVDVQIQQEIPSLLSTPLLDVLASVVPPTPTNPTPPPIPITSTITITEVPTSTSVNFESETLSALQLRVFDLEKEVKELKQADLSTTLRASIRSEVPSAVNLGSSLGYALQKDLQKHTEELRQEYSQKSTSEIRNIKMEHAEKKQKSQYTINHLIRLHLLSLIRNNPCLIPCMNPNQGVADLIKHKKRPHDDDDRDQDPLAGPDQGLKKRKTSKDAEPPKKPKSTGSSKDTTCSQSKSTAPIPDPEWIQGKSVDNEPA